jgi:hypothetical protein
LAAKRRAALGNRVEARPAIRRQGVGRGFANRLISLIEAAPRKGVAGRSSLSDVTQPTGPGGLKIE